MDLKKIGKFIAEQRKKAGFSQESLAEELDVSNRSISKWERGICLPETTKMPALCKLFNITINDLFSGEIVDMKNHEKKSNENLLAIAKEKEQKDKLKECNSFARRARGGGLHRPQHPRYRRVRGHPRA